MTSRCFPEFPRPWGWQIQDCPDVCGALPDWSFKNCDLEVFDELQDYILITLYTDRKDDSAPQGEQGGWWGDKYFDEPIGTRLWTLEGAPNNDDTLLAAERFIREGLKPLYEIRAVGGFDVSTEFIDGCIPSITIDIYGQRGERIYASRFERLWS